MDGPARMGANLFIIIIIMKSQHIIHHVTIFKLGRRPDLRQVYDRALRGGPKTQN